MPVSGGKPELTDRIAHFLATGEIAKASVKRKKPTDVGPITENTTIEPDIVFSEKHRAFFKEKIGKSFSFNVLFQKWLKANAGKTYDEAINAYYQLLEEKKKSKTAMNTTHTFVIFLKIMPEKVCKTQLNAGSIKRVCPVTTDMNARILMRSADWLILLFCVYPHSKQNHPPLIANGG